LNGSCVVGTREWNGTNLGWWDDVWVACVIFSERSVLASTVPPHTAPGRPNSTRLTVPRESTCLVVGGSKPEAPETGECGKSYGGLKFQGRFAEAISSRGVRVPRYLTRSKTCAFSSSTSPTRFGVEKVAFRGRKMRKTFGNSQVVGLLCSTVVLKSVFLGVFTMESPSLGESTGAILGTLF